MFWSRDLRLVNENDVYNRMCPWLHAWKSTLTELSKLCLVNWSLHKWRSTTEISMGFLCFGWAATSLSSHSKPAWPAPDSWPRRGWTSFIPSRKAQSEVKQWGGWRKTEKQPSSWWTSALSTATEKSQKVFSFQEKIYGGWVLGQLCHHVQFLECGNLHLSVYGMEMETSST